MSGYMGRASMLNNYNLVHSEKSKLLTVDSSNILDNFVTKKEAQSQNMNWVYALHLDAKRNALNAMRGHFKDHKWFAADVILKIFGKVYFR